MASHFGVSETTSEYPYQGMESLIYILESKMEPRKDDMAGTSTSFVIFSGVDEQTFKQYFSKALTRLPHHSLQCYLHTDKLLLLQMITAAHETAHTWLHSQTFTMFEEMGVTQQIRLLSRASVQSGNRTKEPDQSYVPKVLPAGRADHWPSVVIETGYSESKTHLVNSAQWWVEASDGDVKSAITISIEKRSRTITLTHWQPISRPTRAKPDRVVAEPWETVISQKDNLSPINISNGTLSVPFASFLLRAATPDSAERDFGWTSAQLEHLASEVWERYPKI
ncbi:hypothetical protein ASPZODRAFT_77076 [Penicilliopsis zonata CBS 506.65]|uniref:Uncharacterized protein n=1 Tax=Penicilliopsis zonata CBS 506.65 TaxID=1073090 RepID=A0A1L9S5B5_9EURO|nr:hypothetical protein ASPZODRAFT_77076 [Penicilliopsis zonata CBS 506.65]OJJ42354.1 hypothetical protein ASPZODRAFT_77076 [Penicilliopsis zonata CBS 506.65]